MATFYSHNGSYPVLLPNRIYLSDGRSRTDKTSFTAEELADAGWVAVSNPPTATYPNKLDWDGTDWVVRPPNAIEIAARWADIRNIRNERLKQTDIYLLRAYEQGLTPDQVWVTYRQALRDIPQNNADPFFITWPSLPEE